MLKLVPFGSDSIFPHQGRNMKGRTPYQVFADELPKNEKQVKTEPKK
jgi:hypothetical protein